jgi:leucyl aminopeptidase
MLEVCPVIPYLADATADASPIWPITRKGFAAWKKNQPPATARWAEACEFEAKPGRFLLVPGQGGRLAGVLLGVAAEPDMWAYAGLPAALPEGLYSIAGKLRRNQATSAALGWALGTYSFNRYREASAQRFASLAWPAGADRRHVEHAAEAIRLVRDLVNTPAADLGPAELADAAETLAAAHNAKAEVIVGDDLLTRNYPLIHAVGRASTRAPRLIDIRWGRSEHPKVTLVGKGVCFDSGGLDLKPSTGMALMKKDMGGAATVLGLARLIMDTKLPVRLRVLIPAVENSVAGNAYRPGDVLRSRQGTTVEIGNTDAEGRLVLADALTEADGETPEILIDCATLTGAARVALGPDLPALYTDDDAFAAELARHGQATADPHWRMPLYAPYRAMIDSKIADINNAGEGGMAGSITAALFLKDFVHKARTWAHFDLYAWNLKARPGRPIGGEAMMLRALFALLAERYRK